MASCPQCEGALSAALYLGPETDWGGDRQLRAGRGTGCLCALCPVSTPCPTQGPFTHLSVMIAAYLGRLRTKTLGEAEVGAGGGPSLEEWVRAGGAGSKPWVSTLAEQEQAT